MVSTGHTSIDFVLLAAAIATALAVLFRTGRSVARAFAKAVRTIDLINSELRPNGGSSLRDAVNRIEYTQGGLARQLDEHIKHHEGVT